MMYTPNYHDIKQTLAIFDDFQIKYKAGDIPEHFSSKQAFYTWRYEIIKKHLWGD